MLFSLKQLVFQPEGCNWVGKLIPLYSLQTCTGLINVLGLPLLKKGWGMTEYCFKIYYEDMSLTLSPKLAVLALCGTIAWFYTQLSVLVFSSWSLRGSALDTEQSISRVGFWFCLCHISWFFSSCSYVGPLSRYSSAGHNDGAVFSFACH